MPNGRLSRTPIAVPTSAISKVSSRAQPTATSRSGLGGSMSTTIRPMFGSPVMRAETDISAPSMERTKKAIPIT
jgi:hypothetical protein